MLDINGILFSHNELINGFEKNIYGKLENGELVEITFFEETTETIVSGKRPWQHFKVYNINFKDNFNENLNPIKIHVYLDEISDLFRRQLKDINSQIVFENQNYILKLEKNNNSVVLFTFIVKFPFLKRQFNYFIRRLAELISVLSLSRVNIRKTIFIYRNNKITNLNYFNISKRKQSCKGLAIGRYLRLQKKQFTFVFKEDYKFDQLLKILVEILMVKCIQKLN